MSRELRWILGILLVVLVVVFMFLWQPWVRSAAPEIAEIVRTVEVERIVEVVVEKIVEVEVEKIVEVMVTATPSPTPMATPNPMDRDVSELTVGELAELLVELQPGLAPAARITETEVLTTQWFTVTGVITEVVTIKQNPSGCNLPIEVCYVVDEAGVLGADDYDEAMANESAIWTGSADHQMADQKIIGALVPEGSYLTAYASGFRIVGGGYELEFPECGELCAWGFLARGWFAETQADRHVAIEVTNLGAVGGMKYTRYPVPVHAGQFFSEDYLTAQAQNTLEFDNCGIEDDCQEFRQAIFDYNDGSLTILRFTAKDGWELLWTNVQMPSQP